MTSLQQELVEIANRYRLELLICFGSYMTEYYHDESDIDLACLSEHPLELEDRMNLLRELSLAYRKSEIDLVDLQTADPVLRCEVAINGRLLYEREEGLFERYGLYYVKRFYELRPIIEEEMEAITRRIREVVEGD